MRQIRTIGVEIRRRGGEIFVSQVSNLCGELNRRWTAPQGKIFVGTPQSQIHEKLQCAGSSFRLLKGTEEFNGVTLVARFIPPRRILL